MEAFMPNWRLMSNPFNWLIVGFTLLVILSASHILFGRNIAEDQ